jgi:hypothetical protein
MITVGIHSSEVSVGTEASAAVAFHDCVDHRTGIPGLSFPDEEPVLSETRGLSPAHQRTHTWISKDPLNKKRPRFIVTISQPKEKRARVNFLKKSY